MAGLPQGTEIQMSDQQESEETTTKQGIDDSCRELFTRNMALFEHWTPGVAAQLREIKNPLSTLVRVGEDDWDIEFGGIPLYGMGAKALAKEQVDEFLAKPTQITLSSPKNTQYDCYGQIFHDDLVAAFDGDGISLGDELASNDAFHLVSMGIGLGFHLPDLMDRVNCGNLILLEVNFEFIYHSLFVFDWQQIFDPIKRPNMTVSFLTKIDSIKTPITIRENMRTTNPALFEGTKIILHYPSDEYQGVFHSLMKNISLTFSGLGFLSDEIRMVRNSYLTLKSNQSLMFLNLNKDTDWPVILVGSGPSLDDTIEHLKRVADTAIVICCGTALPALLRHGVRPDIFAILENGPEIYDYVKQAAETWGLEGITLIGTTTIDPRLPSLFERSVLFMRGGLASFPLFCRDPQTALHWGHPTVTNTGLAIALALGYKSIYLFGVDLGSREPKRHHSALSPYLADNMDYDGVMDLPVPGNLGGIVYADYVLNWSRDSFEQAITAHRMTHRVLNCSDGAFIRGTTPKLARTLDLPAPKSDKTEELESVWSQLSPYGEKSFREAWCLDRLLEGQNALRDELQNALKGCENIRVAFAKMVPLLICQNARPHHHFIRGTLLQYMIITNYYYLRSREDQRKAVSSIQIEKLRLAIDDLTSRIETFLKDLDAGIDRGPWLLNGKGEPSEW